jgi:hypothetical protein
MKSHIYAAIDAGFNRESRATIGSSIQVSDWLAYRVNEEIVTAECRGFL